MKLEINTESLKSEHNWMKDPIPLIEVTFNCKFIKKGERHNYTDGEIHLLFSDGIEAKGNVWNYQCLRISKIFPACWG